MSFFLLTLVFPESKYYYLIDEPERKKWQEHLKHFNINAGSSKVWATTKSHSNPEKNLFRMSDRSEEEPNTISPSRGGTTTVYNVWGFCTCHQKRNVVQIPTSSKVLFSWLNLTPQPVIRHPNSCRYLANGQGVPAMEARKSPVAKILEVLLLPSIRVCFPAADHQHRFREQ